MAGAIPPLRGLLRLWFSAPEHPLEAFGLHFRNPIGLAAGYDKDGLGWRGLACLGFGHIETGTVTLVPQPGNPRPRLFRIPAEQALINRMGFPGLGADFLYRHLLKRKQGGLVIGVNIGKNKDTPLEEAPEEYRRLYERFNPVSDYIAVNVSSPNTLGLRRLQGRQALENLLSVLSSARQEFTQRSLHPAPILVKLAPDLDDADLEDALAAIQGAAMDGVIAANTTLSREGLQSSLGKETGGLSGAPLRERSTAMIRKIHALTGGRLPIIGVGGVMDTASAQEKIDAGASLVQIYTGLVYAGPGLVKQILKQL